MLLLEARIDAPVACDMSTATDTVPERLRAYGELFGRDLLRRERSANAVVFAFRPEARATVEDLARREAACCPFLEYRVAADGGEVIWTISDPGRRADAVLDEFVALSRAA